MMEWTPPPDGIDRRTVKKMLAVARILGDGTRRRTQAFTHLQSHYLFRDRFARPRKGNDKGKVETLVKTARRRFMVPIPKVHEAPGRGTVRRAVPGHSPRLLVEAPVSSMKTSRSGFRSGWATNQAWRRRRTSGRRCSLACALFLNVIRRRSSRRQIVLCATTRPWAASRCSASSAKVMSGVTSTRDRISSPWASIRYER